MGALAAVADWLIGPDPLETVAVLFGIVSVWLSVRENIWSWPTAMVNVGLYIVVFGRIKLYADAGLQVVYLLLSAWGWYNWLFGGAQHATLRVTNATRRDLLWLAPLVVVGSAALGHALATRTDASLPYLDAALTVVSLAAQWLMTRKKVENWLLWIAVDIVYIPMYVYKDVPRTAALYAVFLGLAVLGLRQWRAAAARAITDGEPGDDPGPATGAAAARVA